MSKITTNTEKTNEYAYRMPFEFPHSEFKLVNGVLHESETGDFGPVDDEHLPSRSEYVRLAKIAEMLELAP